MKNFDNKLYKALITDIIGDTFYSDTSYRCKISAIRQYAEVIVRKIIDYEPKKKLMLGDVNVKQKIRKLHNHKFLEKSIEIIKKYGNDSTHTQIIDEISEDDYNNTVDSLFDLIAFLFISYFDKYKFGSNPDIMTLFSILPPIIRVKVLEYLYKSDRFNINVIDKLSIALLKTYNLEDSLKWIDDNKNHLEKLRPMSDEIYNDYVNNIGLEATNMMIKEMGSNMYNLCTFKVKEINCRLTEKGLLYNNFESALPHYLNEKIKSQYNNTESKELIDIMDFLYLGRKEENKNTNSPNEYIVFKLID